MPIINTLCVTNVAMQGSPSEPHARRRTRHLIVVDYFDDEGFGLWNPTPLVPEGSGVGCPLVLPPDNNRWASGYFFAL